MHPPGVARRVTAPATTNLSTTRVRNLPMKAETVELLGLFETDVRYFVPHLPAKLQLRPRDTLGSLVG